MLNADFLVLKVNGIPFQTFSKAIAEYIDFYNNSRIQAKIKWMPPLYRKSRN
ncbi:IS3 family transposase [Faecalibacterium duncaniae]|uniref:IS3 family transposase n=1 Tax=Faecalibacterium duncaniae (strain DSM 17677 / JCM 31915 / A2-165) TaxID=411483 RepID=UPI00374CA59F